MDYNKKILKEIDYSTILQKTTYYIISLKNFEVIYMQIKKGDIVGRYSHNNDILFFVNKIIKVNKIKKIAILKGINIRVQADAEIR